MRYFLHLAYNGSNYRGWQRQPAAVSVQQTLEEAIAKMTGIQVPVIGCGRTDAEVHACRYFAHLDLPEITAYDPAERINRILPDDIAVFDWIKMPPRAHAQYDAHLRTYEYRMHGRANPFLDKLSAYYPLQDLNLAEMEKVVKMWTKHADYRAFCKSPDSYPHTRCRIAAAELRTDAGREYAVLRISADRFLRGMVRLLVGNLILTGQGRMSAEDFAAHLRSGNAPRFYTAAYPQGLYLCDVQYEYSEISVCSHKTVFPGLLF